MAANRGLLEAQRRSARSAAHSRGGLTITANETELPPRAGRAQIEQSGSLMERWPGVGEAGPTRRTTSPGSGNRRTTVTRLARAARIFREVKLHSLRVAHLLLRVAMTHPASIAAQSRCRTTPHSFAASVVAIKSVARFVSVCMNAACAPVIQRSVLGVAQRASCRKTKQRSWLPETVCNLTSRGEVL